MTGRLDGRVALITGTAGGQGAAAARLFEEAGATVVGCDVKEASGVARVDLTDETAVRQWIDSAAAEHGRIDILYANAGATRFNAVEEVSAEEWDFVLRHELDVVFFPVKHAWGHVRDSGNASVGIRVNCISPGMIETPATRGDLLADDHPMRSIARAIPLGRVGRADEAARCALFLASDEASYVTGVNLVVDGGWSAVLPGAELIEASR